MNAQEAALIAIAERLESLGIPYMVIGGMANVVWGEPRATLAIDVTIWVDEGDIDSLPGRLADHFILLPDNPGDFIRQTRVLPLETAAGVRIDVIFGLLPFEQAAIARSVSRTVAGKPIRFCTAEDLVLHKIISEREQDLRDVQGILRRRSPEMDRDYLDPRVQELAEALERPDIWRNYERWLHRR
jgi:hypothetical protein